MIFPTLGVWRLEVSYTKGFVGPSIHMSVQTVFWYWIISLFPNLDMSEIHMKLCVTARFFGKVFFAPKFGKLGQK